MAFTRDITAEGTDATGNTVLALPTNVYNQASGKTLVVQVCWENDSSTCSVADIAGNTYTPLTKVNNGSDAMNTQIFYCLVSLASAVNVVTATFNSGTANYCNVVLNSYTPSGTPSFVAQNSGTGTGTAVATASATAGTMASGSIKDFSGFTMTVGSGWTVVADHAANASHMEDRIDNPGGSIVADGTLSGSANWLAAIATFTDSGGGGSTPTKGRLSLLGVGL